MGSCSLGYDLFSSTPQPVSEAPCSPSGWSYRLLEIQLVLIHFAWSERNKCNLPAIELKGVLVGVAVM
ncbi:unnamed protein product [Cochlearia groenlandica]